jgi:hypothetical protein
MLSAGRPLRACTPRPVIIAAPLEPREGKTEHQKIRACLLGPPERDDNRVRGADDGKGKLLSQVGDKCPSLQCRIVHQQFARAGGILQIAPQVSQGGRDKTLSSICLLDKSGHSLVTFLARQVPRGQAALKGAALRISYELLGRHLHRNIGHD